MTEKDDKGAAVEEVPESTSSTKDTKSDTSSPADQSESKKESTFVVGDKKDKVFDLNSLFHFGKRAAVGALFEDKAYTYHGSLTRPPCLEAVRWFVVARPFPAAREKLDSLLHAVQRMNPSAKLSAMHGDNREVQGLGDRTLHWVRILQGEFPKAVVGLSSKSATQLKWRYVHLYCAAFLLSSIFMVCTAMFLCAFRLCNDEDAARDLTAVHPEESEPATPLRQGS